jgi:hypothetical protein
VLLVISVLLTLPRHLVGRARKGALDHEPGGFFMPVSQESTMSTTTLLIIILVLILLGGGFYGRGRWY